MQTAGVGPAATHELASDRQRLLFRVTPASAVTTPSNEAPHRVLAELLKIGSLGANWDSYGAPAVSPATLRRSGYLVFQLYRAAHTLGVALPEPRVFAAGGGMVGLLWKNAPRDADLEIVVGESKIEGVASTRNDTRPWTPGSDETLEILALVHNLIVRA